MRTSLKQAPTNSGQGTPRMTIITYGRKHSGTGLPPCPLAAPPCVTRSLRSPRGSDSWPYFLRLRSPPSLTTASSPCPEDKDPSPCSPSTKSPLPCSSATTQASDSDESQPVIQFRDVSYGLEPTRNGILNSPVPGRQPSTSLSPTACHVANNDTHPSMGFEWTETRVSRVGSGIPDSEVVNFWTSPLVGGTNDTVGFSENVEAQVVKLRKAYDCLNKADRQLSDRLEKVKRQKDKVLRRLVGKLGSVEGVRHGVRPFLRTAKRDRQELSDWLSMEDGPKKRARRG